MGILDVETLWPLFQTVFSSILEVFIVCSAGYVLASKGILDKKTQKQINKLNVSLLTPALLFSKVAFFLSPAKLKELWIIPILFVTVTLTSMLVAYTLSTIFRIKRSQRNFAMAAAMFQNSNSLPLALMGSLIASQPDAFRWDDDDNKNNMLGRALTYLVLYSTMGMVLRWSYGVRLLAQADDEANPGIDDDSEHAPLGQFEDPFPAPSVSENTLSEEPEDVERRNPYETRLQESQESPFFPSIVVQNTDIARPLPPRRKTSHFYRSFPNSPNASRSALPTPSNLSSEDDDSTDEDELPAAASRRHRMVTPTSTRMQSLLRQTKFRVSKWWKGFNEFMTVPLWAAVASLIVACIRPLQHTLDVHVQPIKGFLASTGGCSIPLTLIVLGAYFYTPKEDPPTEAEIAQERGRSSSLAKSSSTSLINSVRDMFKMNSRPRSMNRKYSTGGTLLSASREKSRPGETKTVFIAVATRMIITPLILLPLMASATKFDFHQIFDDPVFVVSNVLLISSPPALTLAQITQAASGDAFERLISKTIFWSYCILTPPATILVVICGLVLAKL